MQSIASRQNPIVKTFRALAQGRAADQILLDGVHLVEEALAAGWPVATAAISPGLIGPDESGERLVASLRRAGARVVSVTPAVMAAMSPVRTPSGLVAIAARRPAQLDRAFERAPQLVLVLHDVQDPGNVGAVIRAADAAGATGVVTCGVTADPFGWKALRGAMGGTFRVPVADRQPVAAALEAGRRHGLRIVAASPRDGRSLHEVDLTGPVAVLFGGEGGGLPLDAEQAADERLSIPMRPPVESLNVAVAAALVAYEALRQRRASRTTPARTMRRSR